MSGTRHHFLPRFLQEGFVSRRTSGHRYTWVFLKGAPAFETNLSNVGVEAKFYSDGNPDVDERITEAETSQFAPLVKALRDAPPGPVASAGIPELVAHLEVRTRHLRESFGKDAAALLSKYGAFLLDEDAAAERFLQYFLREGHREEARKRGIPPHLLSAAARARAAQLKEGLRPTIQQLASAFRTYSVPAEVKIAHIASLRRAIAPEGRALAYRGLQYSVRETGEARFILGDSAVVCVLVGETRFTPLLDKDANLRAIYLPLTPNRVLVGAADSEELNVGDFGEGSARCSLEFFIAAEESDYQRGLQGMIGSAADMLTDDDMQAIFDEVMREQADGN
ncbi:MAG TPA: DUF4238 domain-containing protein [Terriglobales bacterium]|nr:DUF4238 domain-containing protein [Terriglobales bacterium]HTT21692.1 DUF4238 domain-containing protein [Candidatus Sulfotelmatobacter sp.]